MTYLTSKPDDQVHALQLSHRLVALHVGGIALLIFVVLTTALWISAEHNRLALNSSEELVANEIDSLRARAYTLVKDYSIWNEGYAGVMNNDRDWLFSSIGSSVTEIGTFDLAVIVVPGRDEAFGWVHGSPPRGETGILPEDLLAAILGLIDANPQSSVRNRTLIAAFDGAPWIFAVSRMIPVDGAPAGVASESLPRQIHGFELTEARLEQIGNDLLATDISLGGSPAPGQASIEIVDFNGDTISQVTWSAPRPGASILRKVALPLALALSVATAISAISSLYAVRSARRLERALFAATAADRSKSEFISNVSHELRTPMNGVLGAAQLLETTRLDHEQRELVDVLMASANAQMSLITDLIDLSRIDAGRRRLESRPFEPVRILKEVTDMMRVAASTKQIRLEIDYAAVEGLKLRGDPQAFRQVVTNLVGNAVKFTEEGAVTVRAAADTAEDRPQLIVSVTDTGPGIPEMALPRIFERFYQVDSSMSRTTVGTGLGLAISQRLAQSMGGEIEVSSKLGMGSTFRFTAQFDDLSGAPEARDAA